MEPSLSSSIALVLVGGVVAFAAGGLEAFFRARGDRAALSRAIIAEVGAILAVVKRRDYIQKIRDILDVVDKEPDPEMSRWFSFSVRHDPFAVYNANLDKIGILRSPSPELVVAFYMAANAVLEDVADYKEGTLADLGRDEARKHLTEHVALFERAAELGENIVSHAG